MDDRFNKSLNKGELGEKIVKDILKARGYFVYSVENSGSHPLDFILLRKSDHKIMLFDVKTIARRNKYKDTGIDLADWQNYLEWKNRTGLDFFLLFVDEMLEKVYGNEIGELQKSYYDTELNNMYPLIFKKDWQEIIYFHLDKMRSLANITPEEGELIRSFAQRTHTYQFLKNHSE